MKTIATQWLSGHTTAPGMLACGLGEPDGNWFCHSADDVLCPREKLEQIIRQFPEANQLIAANGLAPSSHTWVFAEGKIRSVTRPDGWILVIVTRGDAVATRTLDGLTAEFLALQPGN